MLRLRRETGSFEPRPHAGGVAPTLDDDALQRLRKLVEETPDATLEVLRQNDGRLRQPDDHLAGLKRLGCREEEVPARRRAGRPEVQDQRREFAEDVGRIAPQRLVFVDETGVTTAMTPGYGRAPRGVRAVDTAPASWESVTVVAAMGRRRGEGPAGVSRGRSTPRRSWPTSNRSWSRSCAAGTW